MPTVGNITEIQSSGGARSDSLHGGAQRALHPAPHPRHGDVSIPNARNFADFPTGAAVEQQQSRCGLGARRRRTCGIASSSTSNTPLSQRRAPRLQRQGSSALPYNITTGLDGNGDTVFNDRPAGIGRNSARGASQWTSNIR
jgi:hypothetical protein